MSNFSLWLVLAGILLIAEITTGTFYLLMVSLGAAIGALMDYLGYGLEIQIGAAAVFAVAGSLLLRNRSLKRTKTDKQHDVLDIGNKLEISSWGVGGRRQCSVPRSQLGRRKHRQHACNRPASNCGCSGQCPESQKHFHARINGMTLSQGCHNQRRNSWKCP